MESPLGDWSLHLEAWSLNHKTAREVPYLSFEWDVWIRIFISLAEYLRVKLSCYSRGYRTSVLFPSVQCLRMLLFSHSVVSDFATPWTAAGFPALLYLPEPAQIQVN